MTMPTPDSATRAEPETAATGPGTRPVPSPVSTASTGPRGRRRPAAGGSVAAGVGLALAAVVIGFSVGRFTGPPPGVSDADLDADPVSLAAEPADAAGGPPADAAGDTGGTAPPAGTAPLVAELEARVADDPDDLAALQQLGVAYTRRAAETGDPAFYDLASSALERATALAPDDLTTTVARGNLALALHDFRDALDLGQRAVVAAPGNEAALGVLVDAQVELGRYDEAARTLQRMLDRNPALPALARTSYLRELNGDLTGAVRAMRQAVAAGGSAYDRAAVTALLGDLHWQRGEVDAAGDAYDRAARLSPGLPAADVGRARVLAARGDRPAAIALLDDLTTRVPLPDALALRADLLRLEGRDAEAADADALVRAVAALQRDAGQVVDLEMAEFEADRAGPGGPDGPDDPGDRAGGGGAARAVELARAAFEARPDNVFTADALAWALHRTGDSAAALPHVERALRLGSADPLLRFHAAAITAATGDEDTARAHLRAALTAPAALLRHAGEVAALADRLGVDAPPIPGAEG